MSFRTSLLRGSLPLRGRPSASLISNTARPFTSATGQSARTFRALPSAYTNNVILGRRNLNTSQIVNLEASKALGDGGIEEPPHSGINVDKPTSMDS
ncbi:hypothetical protein V866_008217 [Kwoniella sp. B9012]|uniref:Uncharacterized protein n=1 Tax=Kwoniella europaea PYCC6329 TaxID=1423913 RepID=A0AAX4KWN5_9TREE